MNQAVTPYQLEASVSTEQKQHLKKYGLLHFKNFIPKEEVHFLLQEIQSVEKHLISHNITKVNGVPLKYGTDVHGGPFIQRLAFTSQYSNVLHEFLNRPAIQSLTDLLEPYESRIGETEKDGLVVNHYLNTGDSAYTRLGWHTDSPRDLFLGSRIKPMLNVGLHLDDCPQSNGGLRVLAGTHNKGLLTLLFRKKYFIDHNPDKKEVGLDIEAGDLTVHDGRLWHRVQQSPHIGEQSRRRVMYIPVITGAYQPKSANSKTAFYHKLALLKTKKHKPLHTVIQPQSITITT